VKFKVGDEVKIIKLEREDHRYYKKGEVGVIGSISGYQNHIHLKNNDGIFLNEGQLELVKKKEVRDRLELVKKEETEDIRSYNVGTSDYAKYKIQPWAIWEEYNLNPWDADIIKRVLRNKEGDSRKLDYEKIVHVCKERMRQLEEKEE